MINTLKSLNWQSAAFWSALAGAVAVVCSTLNINSSLTGSIRDVLTAVGGLLIAIPVHHVVKAQQAAITPTDAPAPPVVPPVA